MTTVYTWIKANAPGLDPETIHYLAIPRLDCRMAT